MPNEFELMKYYREFSVELRTGLSFNAFKKRVEECRDYQRDVMQSILAMRKQHVKDRVFQNTLDFAVEQ